MEQKRKMKMMVTKVSFVEAEEADDLYWANTNTDQRLDSLFELRIMVFGINAGERQRISKVVFKRSLYEPENQF